MKNALEKISKDKEWDEPDLMEYDPDKKEDENFCNNRLLRSIHCLQIGNSH